MLKKYLYPLIYFFVTLFVINPVTVNATEISAGSAVLIEAETGTVICAKDAYQQRSMASTTKIMTVLLCLESGNLDDRFIVDSDAIMVEGSSMGLVKGDIVSKRALCYGMLLPSGNDAANATAVKLAGSLEKFSEMMNERAAEIGMKNTHFVTPSGLEADGEHYSTAYDMALLAREALKNDNFREICGSSTAKVKFGNPPYERTLSNTNKLLNMYEGVIGVKTGFTDEAGRCLVSACERDGITLICVTLNARDDWNDHMKMYDYAFSRTERCIVEDVDYLNIPVVGSDKETVPVIASGEVSYGAVSGISYEISSKRKINSFLYAPVNYGDIVGTVDYYCNGVYIGSADIKAADNADVKYIEKKKSIADKLIGIIRG